MGIDSLTADPINPSTRFYQQLKRVASMSDVTGAILTGAGMGDGAARAITEGLSIKAVSESVKFIPIELSTVKYQTLASAYTFSWYTPINGNTIATSGYLTNVEIISSYFAMPQELRRGTTDRMKAVRDEETGYITNRAGLTDEALSEAIGELSSLDMIVLNGSIFSSQGELEAALNATPGFVCLWDVKGIKNYANDVTMTADEDYTEYSSGSDNGVYWKIYQRE